MLEALETQDVLGDGLITADALRGAGMNAHAVGLLVRRGELRRLRRGWYALGTKWQACGLDGQYRLFTRATAGAAKRPLVLSHHSAAAMHGLPLIGAWPVTVHALVPDAHGGSSHRLVTTHRAVADPNATLIAGVAVTSLARTLVDIAAGCSFLTGVTMIDHVLHQESRRVVPGAGNPGVPAITKAVLFAELDAVRPRTGCQAAERAITFADELSANAGESLSRVRFEELKFQIPELQVQFDVAGRSYFVDYFWRGVRKIGEFDGHTKYTRAAVMNGKDVVGVVLAEKDRESVLRPFVTSFNRWGWNLALNAVEFYRFLCEKGVPRTR
ncbi:hypothetical protein [Cryobacterium sp. M15]|uniref:hypothetical protein n=1 Tax=Cryobacterium sp. M15 TaxID=2048291 RepID=UPI000CE2EEF4|nr:hypothetical protein [Cryobacterium sp. M15]